MDIADISRLEEFRQLVLRCTAAHAKRTEENNLYAFYPAFSAFMSNEELEKQTSKYARFISEYEEQLFLFFQLLEDDKSKDLLIKLMMFRLLGHEHVRLPSNDTKFSNAVASCDLISGRPSEFNTLPGGTGVELYEFDIDNSRMALECVKNNLLFTFFLKQYYYDRDGVVIAPALGDHIVDVGGCFGDTAIAFANDVGPTGHIYSFEPLEGHSQIFNANLARNANITNITLYPCGLSDQEHKGKAVIETVDPGFTDIQKIQVRRLDALVKEGLIPRVDFLKMDIEGHEFAALRGAEQTIRKFRPKLAISLYHRWDDYFTIPLYISSLNLGYKFYLDNYTISDGETILYCLSE